MVIIYLLVFASVSKLTDSAKILGFFPFPGKSHHFVFRPILEELVRRGHEVVYYTGFPYEKPPENITQINLYKYLLPLFNAKVFDQTSFADSPVPLLVKQMYDIGFALAPAQLENKEVQELIHSHENFDAILFQSYFLQEYQSAFIHKFDAVGIEIMPLGDCAWVNELSALPDNPAYQIDYKNENTNELSFFEKLHNIYVTLTLTVSSYYHVWRMQAIVDRYFNYTGWESRPPLYKLVSNRSLVLTNSHFVTGYSVPLAPHRKEIGGINIKANKPLPKDLGKYLDEAPHGVILMSLGSNINVSEIASGSIGRDIMSVFRGLRQNVLLKWEKEYIGELPSNVRVMKWLPQQDVLAHKNVVLFITHGGLLSLSEAVHFGVPLVGIPFFADQVKNLMQVESAGYGRMIRLWNITKDNFSWVVNEVLANNRYKKEATRRSEMFRNRLHSPVEEAAFWIEYSIKFPNALTPKGAFMTFIELHLLDVYAFIFLVLLIFYVLALKMNHILMLFWRHDKIKLKKKLIKNRNKNKNMPLPIKAGKEEKKY